jgi:Flp pilus assembly protein TadG
VSRRSLIARLRDERGSTLIEFALVAPALLVFVLGSFDLGYRAYIQSVLQNAVQKAARDNTLEGSANAAASDAIDGKVKAIIKPIVDNATFTFKRKSFSSFTAAGQAESFTDLNANGICDNGEPYLDDNNNGTWDAAGGGGANGQGGAKDITMYTVKVSYPRIMPMYGLLGWSPNVDLSTTTVLRNQPYGQQAERQTRNCN